MNKLSWLTFFTLGLVLLLAFKLIKEPTPYTFKGITYFPEMPIDTTNIVTIEGAELGRFLFYDSILSIDYSMSCATCHQQKFAFTDRKQFSKGVKGDLLNRNTMPLFNLAWYPSYFWDGRVSSIEKQALIPVSAHNEMNLNWTQAEKRITKSPFYKQLFKQAFGNVKIDSVLISKALAQFERTLISSTSKFDNVLNGKDYLTEDEYKGYGLINDQTKGDCLHCHITDGNGLGANLNFSNNGLDSELTIRDKGLANTTKNTNDNGKFKVPSLRNLVFTAPYMHDGRFKTIKDVLDFYSSGVNNSKYTDSKMTFAHQGGNKLNDIEKAQVLAFLLTLSDSNFVNNSNFSNPFYYEH